MRPLQLKIQAFGPYAGCECVDFEAALQAGLFGIYGPTGSGKSSIFSAIAFALFGETARGGQDTASLRSDHADPDLVTMVELVFDVGPKRYLIRRQPDQMRPAKRGEKMVQDRHTAWLFDVTELSPREIADGNSGKPIAEKKVRDVDSAVRDLLGYGVEQFRQIVLLPQGKFETFLIAKTEERLAILRELFDVSTYRRLTEKFKEEAGEVLANVQSDRRVVAEQLRDAGFTDLEELRTDIVGMESKLKTLKADRASAREVAMAAASALAAGNSLMEKFQARDKARVQLEGLKKRAPEMASIQKRVKCAALAGRAVDLETAKNVTVKALLDLNETHKIALIAFEAAKKRKQASEAALVNISQKETEKKSVEARLTQLEAYLKKIADSESIKGGVLKAESTVNKIQTSYTEIKRQISETDQKRIAEERRLVLAINAERERAKLKEEGATLAEELQKTEEYEKARAGRDQTRNEIKPLKDALLKKKAELAAVETAFRQAEATLAAAQAHHLAKNLVDGEACPVCGSLDHPEPAHQGVHGEARDNAFREAQSAFETVQTELYTLTGTVSAKETLLAEREDALSELAVPAELAEVLRPQIRAMREKYKELSAIESSEGVQARITKLGNLLKTLRSNESTIGDKMTGAKVEFGTSSNALEAALSGLPDEFRDAQKVNEAIEKSQSWLSSFKKSWSEAEAERNNAASAFSGAAATLKASEDAVAKGKAQVSDARRNYEQRLQELGLNEKSFRVGEKDFLELETLQTTLKSHQDGLMMAAEAMKIAAAAVEGLDPPDLVVLLNKKNTADTLSEEAAKLVVQTETRLVQKVSMREGITKRLAEIDAAEEGYKILGRLADDFSGKNLARMTLETYAIASMFDHVLEAANLRLGPMSGGQYSLERSLDQGKGARHRGLGMAVFDFHTGKQRPTDTLSGGESFMAALSLALGLSDVVQNSRGSVRLDTIFIDEGFGSLDRDTLDQALQTLQELTSGSRAVGIISHVDLVQQEIPQGFQIEKGLNGSRVAVREA